MKLISLEQLREATSKKINFLIYDFENYECDEEKSIDLNALDLLLEEESAGKENGEDILIKWGVELHRNFHEFDWEVEEESPLWNMYAALIGAAYGLGYTNCLANRI